MGVNSSAIDKINRQIKMLENYPTSEEETFTETGFEGDTEEVDDDTTTVVIDTIKDFPTNKDESLVSEKTYINVFENNDEKDEIKESSSENNSDESLDSTSIFLVYYIGIIFLVIFAIIILYFIFK